MSADSSYSRIYLTSSNNPYQQIHDISNDSNILAERQKRNRRLIEYRPDAAKRRVSPLLKTVPSRPPAPHPTQSPTPAGTLPIAADDMANVDDDDINRLPESSDEEETQETVVQTASNGELKSAKRKATSVDRPLHRDTSIAGARRSKRRRTSDDQEAPSKRPEKAAAPIASDDDFMLRITQSQEMKRKKVFRKYGSSQTTYTHSSTTPQQKIERTKFQSVSRESTPIAESKDPERTRSRLKHVSSSPLAQRPSRAKAKPDIMHSSPPEEALVPRAVFQDVEALDSGVNPASNTASNSSRSTFFDKPRSNRRESTSSLSSLDSVIEYQLDASQKAALMSDITDLQASQKSSVATALPPNHTLCPTCRKPTSLLNLAGHHPNVDPSSLPLREQTKFCYNHRLRDARSAWDERKYPTIDWDNLSQSDSLRAHIQSLVPLVKRKAPSHHLTNLDNAISAAKGNLSAINRALDTTNVHYGYYGPRGAKILSTAILDNAALQRAVSRQLRTDKNMRTAGPGRLTDCVLLPEVLAGLVRDDFALGDGDEADRRARTILEESVDIGLLLCADDDEVELGSGDDDHDDYE